MPVATRTVSVIIATFNRDKLLDECLNHLERQRFIQGDEIIVVDNGSTDLTSSVIVAHQQSASIPIVGLSEPRPGKSFAVAAALAVARGDIVAFTDDDVNVDARWIEGIRAAMSNDRVALVGGPVRPRWESAPPKWIELPRREGPGYGRLAAPLALVDYGDQEHELGSRTLLGANLAVRRDVLQQVGGFATNLGKLRGTLRSGEDHDLCCRVQAAGYKAAYSPEISVRHFVPIERMRIRYFLDWFYWSGITNAELARSGMHPRRVIGLPMYFLRRFCTATCRALGSAALLQWTAALESAADAAFAIGYTAGVWQQSAGARATRRGHAEARESI
jgi:GT2 family glycosyltransferase